MESLIRVNTFEKKIKNYYQITPKVVDQVLEISRDFKGLKVVNVNATCFGGGVAGMLYSIIPLLQDLGINARWYVLPPDDVFFEVTKKIHNFLQGEDGDLTQEEKKIYLDYNKNLAKSLSCLEADILVIHDPQPMASLSFCEKKQKKVIWRSHLDTSAPNKKIWDFLFPYLKIYDHMVFSIPPFAPSNLDKEKVSFITPVIDPLNPKNFLISKKEARNYVQKFGIDTARPLITQVSRLDPWKDPKGVIKAYRLIKKTIPEIQLALVAQMANDDPQAYTVYEEIKKDIKDEKGIFLLINPKDNELTVNSFQTASDVVLQKSIKEGFGLTVTEAMWKNAVVVGGNVGGIKVQIKDGVNGFLVDSSEEAAKKIIQILNNPQLGEKISRNAHLCVRENFLVPHSMLNWFNLIKKLES